MTARIKNPDSSIGKFESFSFQWIQPLPPAPALDPARGTRRYAPGAFYGARNAP